MQITTIIGKKLDQTQGFLEDGRRVPLTVVKVSGNVVTQLKQTDKEGYNAVQIGFGENKRPDKPTAGHIKAAGLTTNPRFFREVRVDKLPDAEVGSSIVVSEAFEVGDLVDVTGTSKGKGFAGVVKKWHFRGGPRTHGQSDRERARGSSGSGTTPGRVFKGKKMAGHMGDARSTVKNLEVLEVSEDQILVKGLIPGSKGSIVVISKVGKNKKYMPLWSEAGSQKSEVGEDEEQTTKVITAEEIVETPQDTVETAEEIVETPQDTVETAADTVIAEEEAVTASDSEAVSNEEVKKDAS